MSVGRIYTLAPNWEYWYDRTTRCWFGARFDTDGHQIGDAVDAYTKDELLRWLAVENSAASIQHITDARS